MENQLEQLITTKELAEVLGVTDRTIRNTVEKLGNVLSSVATNSQGGFLFNEKQATLIKQEIQSHHNLSLRQIDSVSTNYEMEQRIESISTDYEMELMTQKVLAYHIQKASEYKQRAEVAEQTNALLMHTKHTCTFTAIAKELHRPSRGFAEWLHSEGYVYSQNGDWLPYYGKEDLFEVKQVLINESFSKYITHITQKGRCELLKKYGGNSIG